MHWVFALPLFSRIYFVKTKYIFLHHGPPFYIFLYNIFELLLYMYILIILMYNVDTK